MPERARAARARLPARKSAAVDVWYHICMVRTTVYLPENTKRRMTEAARHSGVSEAEFIRSAIERRLREVLPHRSGRWGTVRFDEPGLARKVDDVLAEGFGEQ